MKRLLLLLVPIFFALAVSTAYAYEIGFIDSLSRERIDGSGFFDIYLSVTNLDTLDSINIEFQAIFAPSDTIACFSCSGDYPVIAGSGTKHVVWNSSLDMLCEETRIAKIRVRAFRVFRAPRTLHSISAGKEHSLYLRSDSTVWASGSNASGQLGVSTPWPWRSLMPIQVQGPGGIGFLTGIISVAAGNYFSLALDKNGNVWSWGDNTYGQLGDSTQTNSNIPVHVRIESAGSYLTDIVAISAGGSFSTALSNDGRLYYWGSGLGGDSIRTQSLVPRYVRGLNGVGIMESVVSISAMLGGIMATRTDGLVYSWGNSRASGWMLGRPITDTIDSNTPDRIVGISGIGYLSSL